MMPRKSEVEVLKRYVPEIDRFVGLLRDSQEKIAELERDLAEKRQAHDEAKAAVKEVKEVEHSTITLLLRFAAPSSPEIMPLFDTMEPSDEKKHGPKSKAWRKEPIAVLGLSAEEDGVTTPRTHQRVRQMPPTRWYEVWRTLENGVTSDVTTLCYIIPALVFEAAFKPIPELVEDELEEWLTNRELVLCPDVCARAIDELRRLRAELLAEKQSAFLREAFRVSDGDRAGWYDSCALAHVMEFGDALVDAGLWERHPEGTGFYRRKRKAAEAEGGKR